MNFSTKYDSPYIIVDVTPEIFKVICSFMLSIGDYELFIHLSNQEANYLQSSNQNKKQRMDMPLKNSNSSLFEVNIYSVLKKFYPYSIISNNTTNLF